MQIIIGLPGYTSATSPNPSIQFITTSPSSFIQNDFGAITGWVWLNDAGDADVIQMFVYDSTFTPLPKHYSLTQLILSANPTGVASYSNYWIQFSAALSFFQPPSPLTPLVAFAFITATTLKQGVGASFFIDNVTRT